VVLAFLFSLFVYNEMLTAKRVQDKIQREHARFVKHNNGKTKELKKVQEEKAALLGTALKQAEKNIEEKHKLQQFTPIEIMEEVKSIFETRNPQQAATQQTVPHSRVFNTQHQDIPPITATSEVVDVPEKGKETKPEYNLPHVHGVHEKNFGVPEQEKEAQEALVEGVRFAARVVKKANTTAVVQPAKKVAVKTVVKKSSAKRKLVGGKVSRTKRKNKPVKKKKRR
jgi:hypothetical protein